MFQPRACVCLKLRICQQKHDNSHKPTHILLVPVLDTQQWFNDMKNKISQYIQSRRLVSCNIQGHSYNLNLSDSNLSRRSTHIRCPSIVNSHIMTTFYLALLGNIFTVKEGIIFSCVWKRSVLWSHFIEADSNKICESGLKGPGGEVNHVYRR